MDLNNQITSHLVNKLCMAVEPYDIGVFRVIELIQYNVGITGSPFDVAARTTATIFKANKLSTLLMLDFDQFVGDVDPSNITEQGWQHIVALNPSAKNHPMYKLRML